jgi:hypothetical protein
MLIFKTRDPSFEHGTNPIERQTQKNNKVKFSRTMKRKLRGKDSKKRSKKKQILIKRKMTKFNIKIS